jgi:enoyl-[acyl-carrier protein] reductase II
MSAHRDFANNPLCRLLGIRYPICQAGMYQVAYGPLAAAVSNAGGLGVIGSAYMPPTMLREEIRIAKAEADKPFGVDILFAKTHGEGPTIEAYESEVRAHIDVTFEENVAVIVSGLGDPGAIVPQAHAAGMKIMALVGTAKQARIVERSGVDAVIASGHEGGGHVGRIGTMVLVPRVVDQVGIPVIAAGGLADGRGLVAALALGAVGVWMGTGFIATAEAKRLNFLREARNEVLVRCGGGPALFGADFFDHVDVAKLLFGRVVGLHCRVRVNVAHGAVVVGHHLRRT